MQEGGMSDKHDVCCEQTLESRLWEKGVTLILAWSSDCSFMWAGSKGRVSMLDLVTHTLGTLLMQGSESSGSG
jgi:hypothetical protein